MASLLASARHGIRRGVSTPMFARMASASASSSSEQPVHLPYFDKILIANRGEIACRVIKTCKKLGIKTVAVYSEADAKSMHVAMADEAYLIGPPAARESYLRMDRIVEVAKKSGAKAIHPGYGFLSENAGFADYCAQNSITFIGPPASAIRSMGSKSESKILMINANVPVVPGYHGDDQSLPRLMTEADKIGYPVLIKAVMGGGGKGMRIVHSREEIEENLLSAQREARASFGDDRVLIERYLLKPRHVELQVFGDTKGNTVYLFERDCSVQRRHQKVIEEAPAPHMPEALRAAMGKAAVDAAKAVGYVGAGTVEFMLDQEGRFYFMEMNTRLQVEHPVTEMITGQDLVEWQLRVAAGYNLPLAQENLKINGHSVEARIYAENPRKNFLPGTGKLEYLKTPAENAQGTVRVETGVRQGDEVSIFYDPMIAKLCVWGETRTDALNKLKLRLDEYRIAGLTTNIDFLGKLCTHPAFIEGDVETGFIEKYKADLLPADESIPSLAYALASTALLSAERSAKKAAASSSSDSTSPWASLSDSRFNVSSSRSIQFLQENSATPNAPSKVAVSVAWPSGSADMSISVQQASNASESFSITSASYDVSNDQLVAFVNGEKHEAVVALFADRAVVFHRGATFELPLRRISYDPAAMGADAKGSLISPMPGKIVKVFVEPGQEVAKGAPILVMEAMKMEHTIRAPQDGVVTKVNYRVNDMVKEKQMLVSFAAKE